MRTKSRQLKSKGLSRVVGETGRWRMARSCLSMDKSGMVQEGADFAFNSPAPMKPSGHSSSSTSNRSRRLSTATANAMAGDCVLADCQSLGETAERDPCPAQISTSALEISKKKSARPCPGIHRFCPRPHLARLPLASVGPAFTHGQTRPRAWRAACTESSVPLLPV